MRETSVTTHYERKLNTGNYSSVTLSAWATIELDDDDDAAEALAHAMSLCREQVREAAVPFTKSAKEKAPVAQDDLFGDAAAAVTNGAYTD